MDSVLSNSPRHLVLRQALKSIAAAENSPPKKWEEGGFPVLDPGEEQIYSFYPPSLKGGSYTIETKQTIKAPKEPATGTNSQVKYEPAATSQVFKVVTPQFELPGDAVHSFYPPQGYNASAETLPHVVFKDPHLPWSRTGSHKHDDGRGQVPWLALLVFTQDEVSLQPSDLNGEDSIFKAAPSVPKPVQPSNTGSIEIKLSELRSLPKTKTPNQDADPEISESKLRALFLKRNLFAELVRTYVKGIGVESQSGSDVSRYKYLAHVRNINTLGMADAGTEDFGLFSVIVSHRVGPLNIHKPTPVIAHLVSLEDVESLSWPIANETSYVALPSLYSWTYTTLPEGSFNVATSMKHLGDTLEMLRPTKAALEDVGKRNVGEKNARFVQRLRDGYTLTRYRVQTGEETAALFRGALTPTLVSHTGDQGKRPLSNSGNDLQIFDPKLNLMDITYSSAWQLGKTMALADQGFCTALARIRNIVERYALNKAKITVKTLEGGYKSLEETISSMADSITALTGLQGAPMATEDLSLINRWKRRKVESTDISLNNPMVAESFENSTAPIVTELTSAVTEPPVTADGNAPPKSDQPTPDVSETIYNELNQPNSTDWQIVLAWLLDRMYLVNIPAQYLIVDPSFLPKESLRFFHIDRNWIDAMVDGALSIGNHIEEHTDTVRFRLKQAINRYLKTDIPKIGRSPQVPTYGCLVRSDVVSQFPDLRVAAPLLNVDTKDLDKQPAAILRHENIDNGVIICLFDRLPAADKLFTLEFTQPPHQQSFVAAAALDEESLTMKYKKIFTKYDGSDRAEDLCENVVFQKPKKFSTNSASSAVVSESTGSGSQPATSADPQVPDPIFAWGEEEEIRTLIFPGWSDNVLQHLKDYMPTGTFTETVATSAMVGIQLNNPIYQLNIDLRPLKTTDLRTVAHDTSLKMMNAWAGRPMMLARMAMAESIPEVTLAVAMPVAEERISSGPVQDSAPYVKIARAMAQVDVDKMKLILQNPSQFVGPASKPTFEYKVYPIKYFVGNRGQRVIPTNADTKQDFVFSIVLKNPADVGTFDLEEIRIVVPTGKPDFDRRNYTITAAYDGPGPTMLSNLRFNAMHEFTNSSVVIRLIPRAVPKPISVGGIVSQVRSVPWKKAREVSFILSLVDVWPYTSPLDVNLSAIEYYTQFRNPFVQSYRASLGPLL